MLHSVLSSFGKNIILVGIVIITAVNLFREWLTGTELIAVQAMAGLAYIFLSCYEFLNTQYKASLPVQRFEYINSSFVMFRVLKSAVFISFAIMLIYSGTRVKYLYPICLTIAATEGLVLWLKIRKNLCFISIYANYLLFVQDKMVKLFASEVASIEFRHDILYFISKDKKSMQIKLEHIEDRKRFMSVLNDWIIRNKVAIGSESALKLAEAGIN